MNLLDPQLSADGGVELTVAGPLATVSLVRGRKRNAQVPATWRALAAVPDHLDESIRVVILRAEGRSFSAGLDTRMFTEGIAGEPSLVELAGLDDAAFDSSVASAQRAFTWWRESAAVTISAVNGHAVGAGFQLALATDLMVVADDAALCMKEPRLGLVPDLGGTWPLVAAVGYPRALEICATGRWVAAEEAVRIGIAVTRTPVEQLEATVRQLVDTILGAPAASVRETKALLRDAGGRDHGQQAAAERAAQRRLITGLAAAGATLGQ